MVKINSENIWVTPTSYGLVITKITSDKKLHRVYLDREATVEFLSEPSDELKKRLKSKQIENKKIFDFREEISEEKRNCDNLIKKNKWLLFSLFPLQISLQTVNYCNAKCDFCYADTPGTSKKKTMSLKQIFAVKDYAALHGTKIGISGGEPLLHPNIYEILRYKNKEVFDTLITNLTPCFNLKKLVETQVDLIQVSIHGYEKTHDKTIGIKNAYSKVKKHIITLMKKGINIATNTVITPQNFKTIKNLLEDLDKIQMDAGKKISYARFVPVMPSGTGFDRYQNNKSLIEKTEKLLLNLMVRYPNIDFEIPIVHANPYEYFYNNERWICPAGSTVAVIRIDNHVVPCNQFLDTNIASRKAVDACHFQDIWVNDDVLSLMRKGLKTDKRKINCEECRYLIMKKEKKLLKKQGKKNLL